MNKKQRLSGIDLCRGLAAYAVILVHSGDETWGVPVGQWATEFRLFFYFAVPFFLATSFYFMTRKVDSQVLTWEFWTLKFQRIVVPCIVWSLIYLVARSLLFLLSNQPERLQELYQDPVAIAFLGGASYHLYFLPLLFVGGFSLLITYALIKQRVKITGIIFCLIASLLIYELNLDSNNAFQLGSYIAFSDILNSLFDGGVKYQLVRIGLVYLSFLIRCLPYLFIAVFLHYIFADCNLKKLQKTSAIYACLSVFLLANANRISLISNALNEMIIAYSLLAFGISWADRLNDSKIIKNLGFCSFGIYLIHPLSMNVVKILISKITPQLTEQVTITSILVISLSSFLLSWWSVNILYKSNWLARYLFGTFSRKNTQTIAYLENR
jgi:peptidoglycan/LPS O-acetylase OafA/YrhL